MQTLQANVTGAKCLSVDQFCAEHGISRAMFYKLRKQEKAPREMKVGSRTLITVEAAAEWRQQMTTKTAA